MTGAPERDRGVAAAAALTNAPTARAKGSPAGGPDRLVTPRVGEVGV